MIIFVEGPRGCGKTHLINQFLQECKHPNLEYYKFYFANHVKWLGLAENDSDPSLHYFSLGNIMTILEMNQRPEYADRIWLFDRALVSAYAWAVLRGRLTIEKAEQEFKKIVGSDLFQNCKTLYVEVENQTADSDRVKDTWDGAHPTEQEAACLKRFLELGSESIMNRSRNNSCIHIKNEFDVDSIDRFKLACYHLLGMDPNK